MKKITSGRILLTVSAMGLGCVQMPAFAGAFQLWEQDGASVGSYHAGRAAIAEDASTAYYNPAGLIRIKNQQFVLGLDPVITDIRFRGTVQLFDTNDLPPPSTAPLPVTVQGGEFDLIPDLHYAAPINDHFAFGLSVVAPFGLATDYGRDTMARYVSTRTALEVVDIAPSLGFTVTDRLSLGFGFDVEHASAEFDLYAGEVTSDGDVPTNMNTSSKNQGKSWGYGYHLGALYQLSEKTRFGVGYQSKITQHLRGSSNFSGPLAVDNVFQSSDNLKSDITFPATTSLSLFHSVNPAWDVMSTISYTQWNVIENIVLVNASGMRDTENVDDITVIVPQHFHNTWNFSFGGNYHVNEQWLVRSGIGFDQSPSQDAYRNLAMPDSDRIAIALGTHFQATKTLAFDLGWTHLFAMNTRINNNNQAVGDQNTITNGSITANADVFGFQVKWDIV